MKKLESKIQSLEAVSPDFRKIIT